MALHLIFLWRVPVNVLSKFGIFASLEVHILEELSVGRLTFFEVKESYPDLLCCLLYKLCQSSSLPFLLLLSIELM